MRSLRKFIVVVVAICMLISITITSNAYMHSDKHCATNDGSYNTNTADKEYVSSGSRYSYMRLKSVSYYGLPTNTFPLGGTLTLKIVNTGTSFPYTQVLDFAIVKNYSVSSRMPTYVGISNNSNMGCTAFYDWNPNYYL